LASGLWDGWRAKCESGWRLALQPAVVTSGAQIDIAGCLQPALPPARMAAAMKDADHDHSVAVNEVKDPKGKSVQKGATY